ncbi:MAG: protein-L-isoaspartate(D-aspartate) O-methyltransferase [Kiritimatiellae bacterium]|nr:protein-L-isoaspartate(D-aspartate) O-methyltransferase [Kiritimatiellia bacterium]
MGSEPSDEPCGMAEAREAMVAKIRACGLLDPAVLAAMGRVRRHAFFPGGAPEPEIAYGDFPCAIGHDATISQPFIVAYMTHRLAIRPGDRVLEIGTGSGYQAAVLAALGARVWTQEIVPELAEHARGALEREGFGDVQVRCAGGCEGWREAAPFDAILVTCAPREVPPRLLDQLADGGRMILPCGPDADSQRLVFVRQRGFESTLENDMPVRFVPMLP